MREDLGLLEHVLVVGEPAPRDHDDLTAYEDALAAAAPTRDFGRRSPDDVMVIYTGGTTGMPKGVVWRHEDIFFAGMMGGNLLGDPHQRPEEVARQAAENGPMTMLPAAPLMHGASQWASFMAFWGGHRVVIVRDFSGHGVLRLVEQEQVNSLTIVGDAMACPILEALDERDYDVSSCSR